MEERPMTSPPLRYVVLHHTACESPHYDLMLEQDAHGALLTWRVNHWPILASDTLIPIAPHRRDYLTYEGPISNDRGWVDRVAAGLYEIRATDACGRTIYLLSDDVVVVLPNST